MAPAGDATRPTTDRVRESIYSSIVSEFGDLSEVHALDAFAGSGALGIEGISRGLASCTFCESDRRAAQALHKNLASFNLKAPRAQVLVQDVFKTRLAGPFELVLLDPPYRFEETQVLALLEDMAEAGALAPEALLVYEHALERKSEVAQVFSESAFTLLRQKKYGKTAVSYFTL